MAIIDVSKVDTTPGPFADEATKIINPEGVFMPSRA